MNQHPVDADERLRFWEAERKRLLKEIEDAKAEVDKQTRAVAQAKLEAENALAAARKALVEATELREEMAVTKEELLLARSNVDAAVKGAKENAQIGVSARTNQSRQQLTPRSH